MKRQHVASDSLSQEEKTKVEKELKLGYLNLADGCFAQAELNFKVSLGMDERCADAWWGLALCKFQISNEDELFIQPVKFKSILFLPECQKALEYASESQKAIFDDLLERINKINQGDNY